LINYDTSFTYTCFDDYQSIVDVPVVRCLANGQLSHQAHCIPRSCHEHPPIILNGRRIFHSTKHGSIARYRCLPGYRIENMNLAKLTCQFGQWIPKQAPKCLPSKFFTCSLSCCFSFSKSNFNIVFCTNPGPLVNGHIYVILKDERISPAPIRSEFRSYIPNVAHGRTIDFECNPGYRLYGPSGLTCNHGRWMPSERPRCLFGK